MLGTRLPRSRHRSFRQPLPCPVPVRLHFPPGQVWRRRQPKPCSIVRARLSPRRAQERRAGLDDTLGNIERLQAEQASAGQGLSTAPFWLTVATLRPDKAGIVQARITALDGSLPPSTAANSVAAGAICRTAAARLHANACVDFLSTTWPAPTAHEVRQLAHMFERGTDPGVPSPDVSLPQLRDTTDALAKLPASILVARLPVDGSRKGAAMRRRLVGTESGEWLSLAHSSAALVPKATSGANLRAFAGLFTGTDPFRDGWPIRLPPATTYSAHGAMHQNPRNTGWTEPKPAPHGSGAVANRDAHPLASG